MKTIESFWEEVKCQIKKTLPDHSYRMWIDPVELLEVDHDHIKLSSPNDYFVKRLKDNYLPIFKQEFSKLGHTDIHIEFTVSSKSKPLSGGKDKTAGTYPAVPLTSKPSKQMKLPGLDVKFNNGRMFKKGYTFDDFVVGDNSNFAYSASLSLAQGKNNGSSILYLLAKTGLGKSHLSQAVGYHIIKNNLSKRVYYVTAEDFTNEMIF
ncbi:MAG: chromosomal replication initiator protein DnaA, partial [Desulfobacula sp.]|nr:chromosomal replication initiator protein DnaA [Desulfobacula sp.]